MTAANEHTLMKWVKIGLIALLVQFAGWIGSTIWGYATLSAEVTHIRSLLEAHTHSQDQYVRKDVWEIRNQFIDEKLQGIDSKLDELIQTIEYEGIYVEPGAGSRARQRMANKKKGDAQ